MPISDGIRAKQFPWVNVALIVANFAVWIFYELPHLGWSVSHASFYPCSVAGSCHAPERWEISWFTAMFLHASWSHILGNMLFLAIFGKNVEDAFGHMRYLVLYVTGGLVAAASQTAATLIAGTSADAFVPVLGASGAIAAALGAYLVLYPQSRILTIIGVFPVRLRAWVFLGIWFVYQLVEAHFGLYSAGAGHGGTAFFAHIGGFLFGAAAATSLVAGRHKAHTLRAPESQVAQ
jgi:membrane associated rhomboid family serine protease